jgi:hypothetical protein
MEEKIRDLMRMLPKIWLEVTHLAKQYVRKLALRDTFKAFQLWKEDRSILISEIELANDQEEKR